MKPDKLIRQLRREIKANPKKAGVLGLLALYALWAWAPLAVRWVSPTSQPTVAAGESTTSPTGNPVAATATAASPSPTTESLSWQELAGRVDHNRLMRPAGSLNWAKDPFVVQVKPRLPEPESIVEAEPETAPEPVAAKPKLTPQAAGLTLSSTIAGTHGGVARINGRSYRTGQKIVCRLDDETVEFELLEVHPRSATLMSGGELYQLEAPPGALAAAIEVE